MKPFRHSALALRSSIAITCVLTLSTGLTTAADIYWDATVNPGSWADAANWSVDATAAGANPGAAPGVSDVAVFTVTPVATGQTINLNGATIPVAGIRTTGQTATSTIAFGTTPSTLVLGASGINHLTGGLTIGSTTAGQEVAVNLAASQSWISSTAGTGAAAVSVRNPVTNTSGAAATLTLDGINTGSIINGVISNGTGVLSVTKTNTSGLWTLDGVNTYTGPTRVNQGTIRLTRSTAADPTVTPVTVAGSATLSLRLGGAAGFTTPQVDALRNLANWEADSILGLDTANASVSYPTDFPFLTNYRVTKLGANTLTLTGNNANHGKIFTISDGALAIPTPANLPPFIALGSAGNLVLYAGGTGFSIDQILAIRQSVDSSTGIFSIATDNGDFVFNQPIETEGTMRIGKTGPNTLFFTADSIYPGGTTLSSGALAISSIANGGVPSPIGQSSSAATSLSFAGGRLRYFGTGHTTDRLFQINASSALEASGTGPLVFSNTGVSGTGAAGNRTFILTGYNKGENRINSVIANPATNNTNAITKYGHGTWVLAGNNTYTGATLLNGGRLVLDYSGSPTADAISTSAITAQTGTLVFRGRSVASTPLDTLTNLIVGSSNYGNNIVILEPNGGVPVNLTVTTFTGTGSTQHHDLIDLSQNAGNSVTVTALATSLKMVNGVLMNNTAAADTNARASLILRDTGGYAFTTATAGAPLQKLVDPAAVTAADTINSATTNYLINSSYTTTATAAFNTLTFDSSAGAVDFVLGATNTLAAGPSGKAALFRGSNNVNISGGPAGGINSGSALWYHNYLGGAAQLNITSNIGNAQTLLFGGPGLTNYTGTGFGSTFVINGGVFRTGLDQTIGATVQFRVTDGIWELASDLSGATAGDFSVASGAGNGFVSLYGTSGFSAYSADPVAVPSRLVNLGGAGAVVTWGANHFLTLPTDGTVDGDFALHLSSSRANALIKFENAINLNGKIRTVEVSNGTADVDAEISGVISGPSGVASGLAKTGTGTLRLSGVNTYTGTTRVTEGTLVISPGVLANASRLEISGSGMLNVSSGTAFVSAVTINGVALPAGPVSNPAVTGNLVVGDTVQTPYDLWVIQKALAAGQSAPLFDADGDGLLNLIEYAVGSEPKIPTGSVVTRNAGLPSVVKFNRAAGRTDINVFLEASTTLGNDWTTIATSTAGTAYVGSANVAVAEAAGAVTVTDNRPGLGSKVFYRLRAVK